MKNPAPPRRRLLLLGLVLPLALLGGCYSRKEAVLVTQRLGTASEQTEKLVGQMQAADAANVAALQELHAAFLAAQQARALGAVAQKESSFLQSVDERQAALFLELNAERGRFITAFAGQVNESVKPLRRKEDELARKAQAAEQANRDFPGDKDRQLAFTQTGAQFLAVETARIQLVADAALQAYRDSDQALTDKTALISTLAEDARKKVRTAATAARARIAAQKPPAVSLPEPGTAAYAALTSYVKAVRASSDGFAHYLQSNSLATKSFLGSFVSGFGSNVVDAVTGALRGDVPKTAEVVKEGTALARSFYQEVLEDNDTNGRAIVDQFKDDAKKAGAELVKTAGDKARAYIDGKLTSLLDSAPPPTN